MSKSALLSLVPHARKQSVWHEEDGKTYIETRQNVDHIVTAAKAMWCDNPPLDMRRVALIPEAVLNKSFVEGWFNDEAAWKRWANDPANECFRTTKGTI